MAFAYGIDNIKIANFFGVGDYDIPQVAPTQTVDCEWIGFNYAKSCKAPDDKGVHFFVDDYQFQRIWNSPDKYTRLLQKFKCVLSPDFSVYRDYPKAMQIWNHYRKHWLAAYWQSVGITVIPTIAWAGEDSYSWCFDGEPKGGVVAVSSVGTQKNKHTKESFTRGYSEMMKRIQPEGVLFFGKIPDGLTGNIVSVPTFQDRFR